VVAAPAVAAKKPQAFSPSFPSKPKVVASASASKPAASSSSSSSGGGGLFGGLFGSGGEEASKPKQAAPVKAGSAPKPGGKLDEVSLQSLKQTIRQEQSQALKALGKK
jgi:hypothetical protein